MRRRIRQRPSLHEGDCAQGRAGADLGNLSGHGGLRFPPPESTELSKPSADGIQPNIVTASHAKNAAFATTSATPSSLWCRRVATAAPRYTPTGNNPQTKKRGVNARYAEIGPTRTAATTSGLGLLRASPNQASRTLSATAGQPSKSGQESTKSNTRRAPVQGQQLAAQHRGRCLRTNRTPQPTRRQGSSAHRRATATGRRGGDPPRPAPLSPAIDEPFEHDSPAGQRWSSAPERATARRRRRWTVPRRAGPVEVLELTHGVGVVRRTGELGFHACRDGRDLALGGRARRGRPNRRLARGNPPVARPPRQRSNRTATAADTPRVQRRARQRARQRHRGPTVRNNRGLWSPTKPPGPDGGRRAVRPSEGLGVTGRCHDLSPCRRMPAGVKTAGIHRT